MLSFDWSCVQACKKVEETAVQHDGTETQKKQIRIPIEADFLYVYSSVPGKPIKFTST